MPLTPTSPIHGPEPSTPGADGASPRTLIRQEVAKALKVKGDGKGDGKKGDGKQP